LGHDDDMSSARQRYVPNELLERLVGFRLFSVQFVLDYVQLRFDGATEDMPVLNCYAMPTVETETGVMINEGEPGYADALRDLIPRVVVATKEKTGLGLRIEFERGSIRLHPHINETFGPEIAQLQGFQDGQWMCWRAGEESFEDLA
jgi:hypothetical protein